MFIIIILIIIIIIIIIIMLPKHQHSFAWSVFIYFTDDRFIHMLQYIILFGNLFITSYTLFFNSGR
jgi:hypothetical protein